MKGTGMLLDARRSLLLIIDFQARLMPAIHEAETALANAGRLMDAAALLEIPAFVTEENSAGLGPSVPAIAQRGYPTLHKQSFDATREEAFRTFLPADRHTVVVVGCEAHVCVLQTVMGLLDEDRRVFVVRDALGSRKAENKEAAIERMSRAGAETITTEMAIFEWLETAEHPRFREAVVLMK
ncbi:MULTISPECIES: isochorismatase family protein [Rhodomicrobium]|uniref:isochorismatase family protein n=1 Tax=Rhodomicrobium TaxID=1068 RepID=UPI001FD9B887|nr:MULTISPECIES: isochorismatase family protein [Rhodomicrobium]